MHPFTDEQLADYEKIERSLTNHTPNAEKIEDIQAIRDHAKVLAGQIILNNAPSRERSLALTHLEETVMWAVKGLILQPVDA